MGRLADLAANVGNNALGQQQFHNSLAADQNARAWEAQDMQRTSGEESQARAIMQDLTARELAGLTDQRQRDLADVNGQYRLMNTGIAQDGQAERQGASIASREGIAANGIASAQEIAAGRNATAERGQDLQSGAAYDKMAMDQALRQEANDIQREKMDAARQAQTARTEREAQQAAARAAAAQQREQRMVYMARLHAAEQERQINEARARDPMNSGPAATGAGNRVGALNGEIGGILDTMGQQAMPRQAPPMQQQQPMPQQDQYQQFWDQPQPGPGGVVQVQTPEQAMSLPPGTVFIDPQGVKRVRP